MDTLKVLIENEIIQIREKGNIRCIYKLTEGYFTNITIDYERLINNTMCLDSLRKYIKYYIKSSSKSILSLRELDLNEYEDQVIHNLIQPFDIPIKPLTYHKQQTAIIGSFSPNVLQKINKVIDYLDNVIVLFGPERSFLIKQIKMTEKIFVLFSPRDLYALSEDERWCIINAN